MLAGVTKAHLDVSSHLSVCLNASHLHVSARTVCRTGKIAGRWCLPAWLRRQPDSHCRCPVTEGSLDLIAPPSLQKCAGRSRTLAGGDPLAQAAPSVASQVPQTTTHTITFYANGIFTVDNGGLGCTSARVAPLCSHVSAACGGHHVLCCFDLCGAVPLGYAAQGILGQCSNAPVLLALRAMLPFLKPVLLAGVEGSARVSVAVHPWRI